MSDLTENLQPGEAPDPTDAEVAANPQTAEERNDSYEPEPEREELTLGTLLESYGFDTATDQREVMAAIAADFGTLPPKYARILGAAGYPIEDYV